MSALDDIAAIAFYANTHLAECIRDFEKARTRLAEAHAEQSVSIRALAVIAADHEYVKRGQELELRAVKVQSHGAVVSESPGSEQGGHP